MKSKKAEEYIEEHILHYSYDGYFRSEDAESAVEIAEQEAEERHEKELQELRDSAVESHIKSCPAYTKCEYTGCKLCRNKSGYNEEGVAYTDMCKCEPDRCIYVIYFTQKLTEKQ